MDKTYEELVEELNQHWIDTAEERKRTHSGVMYEKFKKEVKEWTPPEDWVRQAELDMEGKD